MKPYSALSVVSASLMLMANAQTFEGSGKLWTVSQIFSHNTDLFIFFPGPLKPLFMALVYAYFILLSAGLLTYLSKLAGSLWYYKSG
jgi:hypothetical protein